MKTKVETSFHKLAEIGNIGITGITGFITWKQKIQQGNVTPVSIEPRTSATWKWFSALWTIETCATWYISNLYSYDHALLVLTKWSKSKIKVVQEQKTI